MNSNWNIFLILLSKTINKINYNKNSTTTTNLRDFFGDDGSVLATVRAVYDQLLHRNLDRDWLLHRNVDMLVYFDRHWFLDGIRHILLNFVYDDLLDRDRYGLDDRHGHGMRYFNFHGVRLGDWDGHRLGHGNGYRVRNLNSHVLVYRDGHRFVDFLRLLDRVAAVVSPVARKPSMG